MCKGMEMMYITPLRRKFSSVVSSP